jgi:basic membrane protein A
LASGSARRTAAEARGVKAIGSLIDYTPRYPETVFANAIWNYGPTIAAIVADVQAGNPVGRDYTEYSFMSYGGNELIYVPDMVPAEAIPAMEAKQAMIQSPASSRCRSTRTNRPKGRA